MRGSKDLLELIAVGIKVSGGTAPMTLQAADEEEAAQMRRLLRGKRGAGVLDVQTLEQLETTHRAHVERKLQ